MRPCFKVQIKKKQVDHLLGLNEALEFSPSTIFIGIFIGEGQPNDSTKTFSRTIEWNIGFFVYILNICIYFVYVLICGEILCVTETWGTW